ncbi:50S ribosomal protein L23 [Candidatus Saccharibacteria bacterium]|nr:50S ribosomal protein L23 [Candidatus Saccharibacteria bacterium]
MAEANVKPQIIPRITEKAYAEQTKNTYIFEVPLGAEKLAVKRAIEGQFGVTITSIRTLIRNGKPTRFSRGKHAYPGNTFRRNRKYAYITLKDGDKIPGIFEEESAEETKETKSKKGDK